MIDWDNLIRVAQRAQEHAYAPYSRFRVGTALQVGGGIVVEGCNVENASYGLTNCAERTAVFAAISGGHRTLEALALVTDASPPSMPCGACRQVLREFALDLPILAINLTGERIETSLSQLLPQSFGPEDLIERKPG